ncbi:rhomboid family intramembrane serine protease [Novipirellula artificiosorum]|uniref:Rhomboid protease GluP n=1 Tax=Novipirellula artificiosorum TaxID=2528016 RepID=A0A5C6D0Z5_9BACT|nr:rhomboid family intramembrane serine protease [Novipirellula artificiosorum]TWU30550.1 Rhomboid protease GluP [Novipirellula artificiosorum]
MGLYDRDYGRNDARTPWDRIESPKSMTIVLIVINVVVFFLDMIFDGTLWPWLATHGSTLLQPWMWWEFLTYGFAHDPHNLNHILFNMIGLFFFGRVVERQVGQQEFLKFYLIAVILGGIVASVSFLVQGVNGSVIGASGAVVAITILFACYYPNAEILLMFVLPVKAWVVAVIFVAADFAGALGITSGLGANTAFEVHLTGAAFALAYFFLHWNLRWLGFNFLTEIPNQMRQRSRRMKLKIHDPEKKMEKEAEEADRILAKIHQSGESSLSKSERNTLERYSRRQRERRDRS